MAMGLFGCTSPNAVSFVTSEEATIYTTDEYHSDASRGDVLVVVRGGLPGVNQGTLTNYVVAHMQGADWGPHAHFTATPGPNIAKMFSFQMMINGPNDVTGAALCANPTRPLPPVQPAAAGDITLVAAICRYTQAMLVVTGRAHGVNDLTDIKFHQLIAGAVQELTTPRQNSPFDDHGGRDFLRIR
jgi:hypothetical protein